MRRLWGTLVNDIRLQWRNGFYYATGVMLAVFVLLLVQAPREDVRFLLPAVIVNNIIVNGFFFVAGLVLLEKSEESLQAQVVTPLRPVEYVASKALSLTLLSIIENGLLAYLAMGGAVSPGWLLWGIGTGTCFFMLCGLITVVRYDALNAFLLPSVGVSTLLALPLLPYFGVGETALTTALIYVHPLQPVLLALQAGTGGALAGWQVVYVLLYGVVCNALALLLALRAYERFVRHAGVGLRRQEQVA